MAASHPRQIGRYEVFGELGHGGFGRVYRAYDPTVGRPVALKVLSDVSNDMLTRFRNEAKVAGNLRHNSIVTVYEYGTHDGAPFLAMEYLEGEDLHHVISSRRPLSLLDKCNIMSQVADGLLYAHNNGVIHRDMKPANIMVLRDGAVKIMDFGIARLTRTPDATRLTQEGYLIGTLRYMAPEQLASADFDARSDIFAYGVIFYELLAGRHPFEAPDAQSLMYKLSFEEPAPIGMAAPEVPDPLQQVILKTLRKDRERRYQSLSEIKFDTEPIRIELQKARASELLLQARSLLEEESLEPAQKVVQEALALEPANTTARQLREKIQQNLQKRILQPRIEGLLSSGEEHLAGRRFREAVQAFESALALDEGNSYIRGRVEEARALVDHAGRADQLLTEARREFEQQNLTAAYRMISEALRHDPRNPEAAEFLKTIETYAERRQAEQRVDDAIRKVQGLLLIPAYDQAIAVLAPLNQDSPRIRECLERVRSEKAAYERKQKLRKEMTEATDLLRSSRFDEAARRLEALRKEFPEDQEAADLLAYALREQSAVARTKAVEEAAAEARARSRQNDFEGALAVLESASKQYPGESSLLRLLNSVMGNKSAWERENAIRAAIASCESLRSERRIEEAIEAIKAALTVHGGEPRLASLARQLEDECARERRNEAVRKISRRAEELLAAKLPEAAVETLQKGLKRYAGDAVLERALKLAREQVLNREKARAADRAAAIDKLGREAGARAASGDFEAALELLDEGLRKWPDAGSLADLRGSTLALRDRSVKRARALRELSEIQRSALQQSGTREAAELVALASRITSEYPQDQEIQSIAAAPIALLSDLLRAGQLLADGNFQVVLEICRRRLEQYPRQPAFLEFQREAEYGQKRAQIQELQRCAAAEPDLARRCRILEQALKQHPNEGVIADELHFTGNKLALVNSIVDEARARERLGRWEEALEKWKSLLAVYAEYPGLKTQIERAQQSARKSRSPATSPAQTTPTKARRRIRVLIAGGAAAALLAGGIFAFRARRPADIPTSAAVNVPTTASKAPAVSPALPETPAVDSKKPDNPPPSADRTPAPARPEQFRSDKAVRQERRQVAMPTVAKPVPVQVPAPAPPPPPDPKQIDAQEWAQTANSTNPDEFDSFIRNHPGSAHLEQARGRAAELRLQARARTAQQLDQTAWEKLDQRNREQLEDYVSRFPSGMHVQEARARIADAERQAAEALAAQRAREQRDQEQARHASEQQAIVGVLKEFEAAYNKRDLAALQRIWKALPAATYRQQFRDAKDLTFQLQLMGQPEIAGNSAVATCARTMSYRGQSGGLQTHSGHVRITLTREPSGWMIRTIESK